MSDGTVPEVLAAMADPTRRALLDSLAEGGEASATSLALGLPVTRQAVVKHLAVLERAGLVTPRREGREVRYALCPAPLVDAAGWLGGLAADWDARLAGTERGAEG